MILSEVLDRIENFAKKLNVDVEKICICNDDDCTIFSSIDMIRHHTDYRIMKDFRVQTRYIAMVSNKRDNWMKVHIKLM